MTLPIAPHVDTCRQRHPLWIALAVSLWMAAVCNVSLWQNLFALPAFGADWRSIVFAVCFGLMIACLHMALLALLAWKPLIKPAALILLLMAGFGAHFMLLYRIVIDADMLANVAQTNLTEARDLLNLRMLLVVGVLSLLPALVLWRIPVKPAASVGRRLLQNLGAALLAMLLLALLLLANYQTLAGLMRNEKNLRYQINPLNSVYALTEFALVRPLLKPRTFEPVGQDAHLGPSYQHPASKPPLFVIVLGETARAPNFSLNGYARDTNPLLRQEQVASFTNVWSCGTSTATSLPCMFSHLGKDAYEDRKSDTSTLMDVLQQSGLAVLWIDNQAGCKGVCNRVPNISTMQLQDPQWCADGECLDQIVLKNLDQRLAELPAERRAKGIVLVFHQMGSHGPAYARRSHTGTKKFLPECTTNVLQDCQREHLLNAYDNSIANTDAFLHASIAWLKAHEADYAPALLYLSDHGESLGENNLYLHGLPYSIAPDVQKHVPLIVWQSPAAQQRTGVSTDCLLARRDEKLSHDNFYHSVLGLLDVQTRLYRPELDIGTACRNAPAGNG